MATSAPFEFPLSDWLARRGQASHWPERDRSERAAIVWSMEERGWPDSSTMASAKSGRKECCACTKCARGAGGDSGKTVPSARSFVPEPDRLALRSIAANETIMHWRSYRAGHATEAHRETCNNAGVRLFVYRAADSSCHARLVRGDYDIKCRRAYRFRHLRRCVRRRRSHAVERVRFATVHLPGESVDCV